MTALRRHFGDATPIWGGGAGLHLTWFPPTGYGSPAALADLARQGGLEAAVPGGDRRLSDSAVRAVLLGFGSLAEQQIESRVSWFAESLAAGWPGTVFSAG